jgi:undecaprenyl-diphosphatase
MESLIRICSLLGSFPFFILYIIIAAFLSSRLALQMLFLVVITLLVASIIRAIHFKERPKRKSYTNWIEKLYASSFPSLHTMRATAVPMLFLFSTPALGIALALLAACVSYSRIALKAHDMDDVIAGAILGVFLGCITAWIM